MAGVTGHKALTNGLFKHLVEAENAMKFDAWNAAVQSAAAGQAAIKETINTTPSSLSPGKPHRNFTYRMNHAVDSDVKRNGNTISIRAGWLNDKAAYFLIQEEGSENNGTTITPMNALMYGRAAIIETLKEWGLDAS